MRSSTALLLVAVLILVSAWANVLAESAGSESSVPEVIEVREFVFAALRELTGATELDSVTAVVFRSEAGFEIFGIESSWVVQRGEEGLMHNGSVLEPV